MQILKFFKKSRTTKTPIGIATAIQFKAPWVSLNQIKFQATGKPQWIASQSQSCANIKELLSCLLVWREEYQLNNNHISLVLPQEQYRLVLMDQIEVPDEELPQAARWKVKDIEEVSLNDAAIQVFRIPPYGIGLQKKKMYTIIARLPFLTEITECFDLARVKLNTIDIEELALCNLLATLENSQEFTAFLQIHSHGIEIIFLQDHSIYLIRQLPIDLHNIENDLINSDKQQQILLEIQRSYDYCVSELGFNLPKKLFFFSHPLLNQQFKSLLTEHLSSPIHEILHSDIFDINFHTDSSHAQINNPSLGGAMRFILENNYAPEN